ncbi:hypothetical protein AK812_SmicGene36919 [Symbiodinium microadriaticum]|uniref:Uncharacterized protein n=1 Tax=Symbiodinium microadriaticum TaxID=2951 RepID=A0A1Q9CHN4_SYMMI|nr:hypothetical protein AK812_SmicGene36919 [Symbiodinium microadriaticum]
MDIGRDVTRIWQRLDEFVTTDSNFECDRIIAEALAIADRLYHAQVGLAEAVYRREWNEDWAPLMSCEIPGTRSGGLAGCRFEHPDEHSNGPMSSLRLRMNSLAMIDTVQNGPNDCMVETTWYAMTKAERMFFTKANWHIEWKYSPSAKENVTHDLVNVYEWVMLPQVWERSVTRMVRLTSLNGSFNALSAMRKTVQWFCQDCFEESAATEGVVFVLRRRSKVEAQRQWVAASNGKMKSDNYFNRQFTDHITTQKWIWTVPEASLKSMGIARMPLNDPMMLTTNGPPLLCLGETSDWNRLATMKHCGLIDWRLMGHTMVPVQQAFGAGLDHDSSTWDELYGDEDENANAWNGPASSSTASKKRTAENAFPGSATVISQVANALVPGAEVVLRMNANAKGK